MERTERAALLINNYTTSYRGKIATFNPHRDISLSLVANTNDSLHKEKSSFPVSPSPHRNTSAC